MSIFEGEDEAAVDHGRVSELSSSVPHQLRLDPFRRGIAAVLDAEGARVGTLVSDVQVWWRKEGLFRKRDVDPREVVALQIMFEPVELGEDGYPVALPWVDQYLEADDPMIDDLLEGTLDYAGRPLRLQWFLGGDAAREHSDKDRMFDLYPDVEPED